MVARRLLLRRTLKATGLSLGLAALALLYPAVGLYGERTVPTLAFLLGMHAPGALLFSLVLAGYASETEREPGNPRRWILLLGMVFGALQLLTSVVLMFFWGWAGIVYLRLMAVPCLASGVGMGLGCRRSLR